MGNRDIGDLSNQSKDITRSVHRTSFHRAIVAGSLQGGNLRFQIAGGLSISIAATANYNRAMAHSQQTDELVPDSVIPHGALPPLRYRDLPEPVAIRRMIGPSIILAGLALGSGELVFWPKLTFQGGFTFFWACIVGVATQYFINMEIARWTLATGESAITGFSRLSRHWAWVFLLCNVIPWMIPAWARGGAELVSWLIWGPTLKDGQVTSPYVTELAIGGLFLCGLILTAGPVIYETVEKIQLVLVTLIIVSVIAIACLVVRADAVQAQVSGTLRFGWPSMTGDLSMAALLGAIAFAGAGGTLNLGQSNYVKEKGYGMGHYIGRITSPITGKAEPVVEIGYHFPHTAENLDRWRRWWRAANTEHFFSFFLTCLVCLVLLTLISYSLFYEPDGVRSASAEQFTKDMAFLWGEALELERRLGGGVKLLFLVMGVAILLTTEFGVLDGTSRISTDIVKVNWLEDNPRWTESRLYYVFLWVTILVGAAILAFGTDRIASFFLFKLTASLNGGVMFLYSMTLLWLNYRLLPADIRIGGWRVAMLVWAVLFFGFFTVLAVYSEIRALL
jgi:hypothetical protein